MENEFLDYLKFERRYSEHTVVSYTNDLNQLKEYLDGFQEESKIADLQSFHIRNWIVELMDQDYAVKSIQRKLSTLKSFYRFLRKKGYRKDNPVSPIIAPKGKKRLPTFADHQGMQTLFSDDCLFESDFEGLRDRLIMLMFYTTGLRLSELIGLQSADVDIDASTIKVLGKRNKERVVPMGGELKKVISQYKKARESKSFIGDELIVLNDGRKLYPKFVYRKVNEYLGRVTTLSKRSPHILRHTFATHMLENGAELQSIKEILGHASLAATQVYTHTDIDRLKKIHSLSHPRG